MALFIAIGSIRANHMVSLMLRNAISAFLDYGTVYCDRIDSSKSDGELDAQKHRNYDESNSGMVATIEPS